MQYEKILKKVVDSTSFCVVGNSPIEIGKNLGPKIDSHNSVIRFNDYSLEFSDDYGIKTDVWVRATNDLVIETLTQKNSFNHKMIFYRAFNKKNIDSIEFLKKKGMKYSAFPIYYENKLSSQLGAIPSTGLLFLFILKVN